MRLAGKRQGRPRMNRAARRTVFGVWMHAAAIALAAPGLALAQATGANIGGVVTDDTGGALPGVTVTLTNKANGAVQTSVTGAAGNYRAVALQPAPYEVKAELSGFNMVKKDVTLTVGADLTLDFKMGVGNLQESLTVIGESPLVEVAKATPTS